MLNEGEIISYTVKRIATYTQHKEQIGVYCFFPAQHWPWGYNYIMDVRIIHKQENVKPSLILMCWKEEL